MHRTQSRAQEALGAALRRRDAAQRSDEVFAAAAAMHTSPEDRSDVPRLELLVDSAWRTSHPFFWQHLVRSVGTAGSPEDAAFLSAQRAKMPTDTEEGRWAATSFDVGL